MRFIPSQVRRALVAARPRFPFSAVPPVPDALAPHIDAFWTIKIQEIAARLNSPMGTQLYQAGWLPLLDPPTTHPTPQQADQFRKVITYIYCILKLKNPATKNYLVKLYQVILPFLEIDFLGHYIDIQSSFRIGRIVNHFGNHTADIIYFLKAYLLRNIEQVDILQLSLILNSIFMAITNTSTPLTYTPAEINQIAAVCTNQIRRMALSPKIASILLTQMRYFRWDHPNLHQEILVQVNRLMQKNAQIFMQMLFSLSENKIEVRNHLLFLNLLTGVENTLLLNPRDQIKLSILISLIILRETVYTTPGKVSTRLDQTIDVMVQVVETLLEMQPNSFVGQGLLLLDAYSRGLPEEQSNATNFKKYKGGFLSPKLKHRFLQEKETGKIESISNFQNKIEKELRRLGLRYETERLCEFVYVDFWLPDFDLGIEALGQIHFLKLRQIMDGRTELKLKILERLGKKILVVNQLEDVRRLLKEHGVIS